MSHNAFEMKRLCIIGLASLSLALAPMTPAEAAGDPKITMAPMTEVQVGYPFLISGKLVNTGARNNKTVVLQRRISSQWTTIAVKRRQDDGPYSFIWTVTAPGTATFRAKVKKHGMLLDRSPHRSITVVKRRPAT